jgi:4-amino-4-deoxy-L-arabinose transferase-like glycosyltransferase
MRPLTAIVLIGAVALPWYVWVGVRTEGKFLSEFFYEHNLGRAAQPMEGHDGPLLLFYPAGILVGFFPWSVFAIPTVIGGAAAIRRRGPWHPGCVLAVCWIAVYVGAFSLAQTKLLNYVTPCYPALALLTACFLVEWMRGSAPMSSLWPTLSLVTLGIVGLGMLIIVPFVAHRLLPGEAWLAALGLIPLLGAAAGIVFIRRGQVRRAVFAAASAAVVFVTAGFGFAMPRVDRHQQMHLLLAAIERTGGSPRVGAYGRLEPTWIFYRGRPIVELGERPRPDPATFFKDGKDTYIITTDRHWDHLRPTLPHEASVLADYPLFLRRERLLLVGLPQPALTAARGTSTKR